VGPACAPAPERKRSVVSAARVHGAPPPTLFPPSQAISFLAIIFCHSRSPQLVWLPVRQAGRTWHWQRAQLKWSQGIPTRLWHWHKPKARSPGCWLRLESLVKVPRHSCRPSENGLAHDTCWSHLLVNRSRKVIGRHGLNRPDPGPSYTERNRKQIS
jgi:hypothetical protein